MSIISHLAGLLNCAANSARQPRQCEASWGAFDGARSGDDRTHSKAIANSIHVARQEGTRSSEILFALGQTNAQGVAQSMLGWHLNEVELPSVVNWMDTIEFTIWMCQQAASAGRAAAADHCPS